MKRTRRNQKCRGERGAVLAELAIVLPLLLFFAIVVFEGAAMIRTHQILNNAAREGARFAAQEQTDADELQQVVVSYAALNNVTITPGEVAVAGQAIPGPNGVMMSATVVTVNHPYTLNILPNLPGSTIPTSFTLVGRAEFRNFY
jgi:Flp pilus assembly protein TadG